MTEPYARARINGQDFSAQKTALEVAGVEKAFSGKVGGAQAKRRQMDLCLGSLKQEEALVVSRLDRLARSTRDGLDIGERISQAGAEFRSLAGGWADTTRPAGRLMLTGFGDIAACGWDLIRARTAEGRAQAKAAGKSLGRPFKLTSHPQAEFRGRKVKGVRTREVARSSISHRVPSAGPGRRWGSVTRHGGSTAGTITYAGMFVKTIAGG